MLPLRTFRASVLLSRGNNSSSSRFVEFLRTSRKSSTNRNEDAYYGNNNINPEDILEERSRGEERLKGKVQFFDRKRGFGFITPDENFERFPENNAFFVHRKALLPLGFVSDRDYMERNINNARTYLEDGEDVEFELREYKDRVHAVNVTGPDGSRLRVWVGHFNLPTDTSP